MMTWALELNSNYASALRVWHPWRCKEEADIGGFQCTKTSTPEGIYSASTWYQVQGLTHRTVATEDEALQAFFVAAAARAAHWHTHAHHPGTSSSRSTQLASHSIDPGPRTSAMTANKRSKHSLSATLPGNGCSVGGQGACGHLSSVSHLFFTLHFKFQRTGGGRVRTSALHIVDLAGTSRGLPEVEPNMAGSFGRAMRGCSVAEREDRHIKRSLGLLEQVSPPLELHTIFSPHGYQVRHDV